MKDGEGLSGRGFGSIRNFFVPIHTSFTRHQPVKVQAREVEQQALQKIIAGFIAAGENMGDGSARHGKGVGKLRLRDVFGLQKL